MQYNEYLKSIRGFLIENPVGVIILAIFSGVVTNLLPGLLPILNSNITVSMWLIILFAISVILFNLFFIVIYIRRYKKIEKAFETKEKIALIEDTLLNYISKLARGLGCGDDVNNLTMNTLAIAATKIEPLKGYGFSIFRPNIKKQTI